MGKWLLLGLALLGCAAARTAGGQRTATDAARVTWFLQRGPRPSPCQPSVTPLTSDAFEVRCGADASFVRCEYASEGPCCWSVATRDEATRGIAVSSGTLKVCN
jgi:hypothetical protein